MDIALKVLYFVLIAAGGWLYFYLGVRQLVFGLTVGYPLIKSFGGTGAFLSREAKKLNTVSVIFWAVICLGFMGIVARFAAPYLIAGFALGALAGLIMYAKRLGRATFGNFEAFCRSYCRFAGDAALRGAMAECDLGKIHSALEALGSPLRFEFKN